MAVIMAVMAVRRLVGLALSFREGEDDGHG